MNGGFSAESQRRTDSQSDSPNSPQRHGMKRFNERAMKEIAMVLLFDRRNRLLIYLRDDKPDIPFPNHWDFFGGHLEEGETPEEALVREVKEELGIELADWSLFRI